MRARPGWVTSRKIVQAIALAVFVGSIVLARGAGSNGELANLPMRLDPLMALTSSLAGRALIAGSALALITLALTLLLGRAWCGWLCPLGTVLGMVPSKRRTRPAVPEVWRRLKYVLLVAIVAAALLGNQTLLFFDPLAILSRTLSTAVWPVVDQAVTGVEDLLSGVPGFDSLFAALDAALRPLVLPSQPLAFEDGLLFAAFFVGLVSLNWFAPRFWCRYLCPLGGMLGLIGRVALFKRDVSGRCSACGLCEEDCPTGTIDPERGYASDPAECTVCMNCVGSCPLGSATFRRRLAPAESQTYDPRRREVVLAIGAAAVGVALFRSDLFGRRQSPFLLRPPGSRETNADAVSLTACTRCGECVAVCPTGGLQPSVLQAGWQGLGTPVLVPRLGYCDYACNVCGTICPTSAIPLLALEDKQRAVIGKAFIDQSRCLAWSDHIECLVCQEMCPLPDKAIQLERQEVWAPGGGRVTVDMPHVVRDACIGCGLCEYRCPVSGDSAIRVYMPQIATPV